MYEVELINTIVIQLLHHGACIPNSPQHCFAICWSCSTNVSRLSLLISSYDTTGCCQVYMVLIAQNAGEIIRKITIKNKSHLKSESYDNNKNTLLIHP